MLSEEEMTAYVYQSNYIEGYPPSHHGPGDPLFDNHIVAARLAENGEWQPKVLHGVLMEGLLLFSWQVGEYRKVQVWIGGKPAINPGSIPYRMREWEEMVNKGPDWTLERWCWKMHDHFEVIHPFVDGNGRVGRLILNALRTMHGLPWLTIHIGEERQAYYQHIREYRANFGRK